MDAIQLTRAITASSCFFHTNPTHFLMNVFRTFVLCIYPVAILLFYLRILYYSL